MQRQSGEIFFYFLYGYHAAVLHPGFVVHQWFTIEGIVTKWLQKIYVQLSIET